MDVRKLLIWEVPKLIYFMKEKSMGSNKGSVYFINVAILIK